jgi:hypothetical protein
MSDMEQPVNADVVNIQQGGAQNVNAGDVTVRQGGVQNVNAETLTIRQGGVAKAKATNLHMVSGGAVFVQTETAEFISSKAGVVVAGGGATIDQGSTRVLVAGGPVTIDQGASAVLVANNVTANNSAVVFLFARNVDGNINAAFGPRESLLFGTVAGLVAGVFLMISSLFRRKKK